MKIRNGTKKTILFFAHNGGDSHITGAENYLFTVIKESRGQYHCILISPLKSMLTAKIEQLGVEVKIIPYPMLWSIWNPNDKLLKEEKSFLSDNSIQKLTGMIKKKKADLVITNTTVNPMPAMAAKKAGVPVVWFLCEVMQVNEFTSDAVQLINRYSDFIVGISNAVLGPFKKESTTKKLYKLNPTFDMKEKKFNYRKGNRHKLRNRLKLKDSDRLVCCMAAYVSPLKGFDHYIKMANSLCNTVNDVHFLIVGKLVDTAYYEECQKLMESLGHKEKFHVLSFVEDVHLIYEAIDIMVIPSLVDEGFSLVCLESLAFGKPVVAYHSGGIIEQMNRTNNNRFLVKKGNIRGLEHKVSRLLCNPILRSTVSQSNRKASQRFYGIGYFRKRLLLLYKKVFG
ncbi:glycosyltransferase family 4 protein [Evansella sp. AB-rgal1]|uniref:glycosyltransferase family 4 protein n=1 Tax=Evansella sp. AB-rgal1 TaxID=3242696 RepID=UPI00359CE29C